MPGQWVEYQGDRGGKGWQDQSGNVVYQDAKPGGGGTAVAEPPTSDAPSPEEHPLNQYTSEDLPQEMKGPFKGLRKSAVKIFKKLENRYGRKAAIAIFVAGHAIGLATPLAVVPGSTFVGMAPFMAIGEVVNFVKKHVGPGADQMSEALDDAGVQKVAQVLVDSLMDQWEPIAGSSQMSDDTDNDQDRDKDGKFASRVGKVGSYAEEAVNKYDQIANDGQTLNTEALKPKRLIERHQEKKKAKEKAEKDAEKARKDAEKAAEKAAKKANASTKPKTQQVKKTNANPQSQSQPTVSGRMSSFKEEDHPRGGDGKFRKVSARRTQSRIDRHKDWLDSKKGGKSASFQDASLEGYDFSNEELTEASFDGANLRNANFRGAVLDYAWFGGADLRGADFEGATLIGAVLEGADLRGANLDGADLEDALMHDVKMSRNTPKQMAQLMDWAGYQGDKGGRGWKNTETGEVRYQTERPTDRTPKGGDQESTGGSSPGELMTGEELKAYGDQWKGTLGEKETMAVKLYMGPDYEDLNRRLRSGEQLETVEGVDQTKLFNFTEAAIAKSDGLPKPVQVYRGIKISDPEKMKEFLGKLQSMIDTDQTFSFGGINSTSISQMGGDTFAPGAGLFQFPQGVLFSIQAKSGAYVSALDDSKAFQEQELLQSIGTRYRVKSVGGARGVGVPGRKVQVELEEIYP